MSPSLFLRTLVLAAASLVPTGAAWAAPCTATQTLHVSPQGGTGATAGSSWNDPASLQHALAQANAGGLGTCYDIRLMRGRYTPTANTADRTAHFAIRRPLMLRGGYTGNGHERVASAQATVLSGDLGGDDRNRTPEGITPAASDISGSNSLHVVVVGGLGPTAGTGPFHATPGDATYTLIERLTITGGKADNMSPQAFPSGSGGGLLCNGQGLACSPHLQDMQFVGNYAVWDGGALISYGRGQPVIVRSTFSGNEAQRGGAIASIGAGEVNEPQISTSRFTQNHTIGGTGDGGAIYFLASNATSNPRVTSTMFHGNTARRGGAIFNESAAGGSLSPIFEGNTFSANTVGSRSWNLSSNFQGGAMANLARGAGSKLEPTLTNNTFVNNSAQQYGGAIFSQVLLGGIANPTVLHSTFLNNEAALGQAILSQPTNGTMTTRVASSILWGANSQLFQTHMASGSGTQTTSVNDSIIVPGGHSAAGNLNADPLLGALEDNGGPTATLRLGAGSPAIDAVTCTASVGIDQRNEARPHGARCDMGALEHSNAHLLRLNVTGNGLITSPSGLLCGHGNTGQCSANFMPAAPPQTATLLAAPDPGLQVTWGGDCAEDPNNPLRAFAAMDAAKTCQATFGPIAYAIGGTVDRLTGPGLVLHNNGENLPIANPGNFRFANRVAPGGSYDVSIASQPAGQSCSIRNTSGTGVTAHVTNVEVTCIPHFEGLTMPATGLPGTASATFTGGGPSCRFDPTETRFEAAPVQQPSWQELPQGMLRLKLVGCTPGSAVRVTVTWPEPVTDYLKHGRDSATATQDRYYAFAPEHLLAISGNTASFTVKDGVLGDDDWTVNGEIADPAGPMVWIAMPANSAHAIPALSGGALALLGLLAALVGSTALRARRDPAMKQFWHSTRIGKAQKAIKK